MSLKIAPTNTSSNFVGKEKAYHDLKRRENKKQLGNPATTVVVVVVVIVVVCVPVVRPPEHHSDSVNLICYLAP